VKEELSESAIKTLKSKGYIWDPNESWWVRVWTANEGKEKILECYSRNGKNQWSKVMVSEKGYIFYEETVDNLE
jgi:hypothetical protein